MRHPELKLPAAMTREQLRAYRYISRCRRRREVKRRIVMLCVDAACAGIVIAWMIAVCAA